MLLGVLQDSLAGFVTCPNSNCLILIVRLSFTLSRKKNVLGFEGKIAFTPGTVNVL